MPCDSDRAKVEEKWGRNKETDGSETGQRGLLTIRLSSLPQTRWKTEEDKNK